MTCRTVVAAGLLWAAAWAPATATRVAGQTPTMPSTQRYGSGLLDVPVSSVLPHLSITGTFSGFWSSIGQRVEVGDAGMPTGYGPARSAFHGDVSAAVGLFDRAEAGLTLQSFNGPEEGGDVWGLFGRVRLWEPIDQGLGLAVGGRYVTKPDYGDGVEYAAGRLGFPDERLRRSYTDGDGLDTDLSLYMVATAFLRGYDGGRLPKNDMSFSLGYGGGMFGAGGGFDFYAPGTSSGWFLGTALHVETSPRSQLTIMAEHNGFDVNVGAQYDWDGLRIGIQGLALNHDWPESGQYSEYQEPKFGFTLSAAICPDQPGFRCRPRMMRRTEPDTIYIPPPPPDTVVVGARPAVAYAGEPASICLSTGQDVPLRITAVGDTLVGNPPVPIRSMRPGLVFAGTYAGSAFWYLDDEVVIFEGADYRKSEDTFPIDCGQILRVGVFEGVPVFSVLDARRPLEVIFIPVRPGLWQRYERGGRLDTDEPRD